MKKWFAGLFLLIGLFIASVYIFIPSTLQLTAIAYTPCTPAGAYRVLSDERQWAGRGTKDGSYHITKKMYNSLDIHVQYDKVSTGSTLHLLPLTTDSLAMQWQCNVPTGNNPFTKIARYKKAVALKKNMSALLQQLGIFLASTKNVYGYTIQRSTTIDTLLVATKTTLPAYPPTPEIYRLINTLSNYIGSQGARQSGAPIVNATRLDEHQYQLMVAIPTDRPLPGNRDIFFRKMVPGAFMVADVKGGDYSVVHALAQMQLYFDDYKKTPMAIPFAALLTDRIREPDTSRWLTRIYAPVY